MIRVTDERDFRVRSVAGRSEEGRFELKPGRRERPRGEETAGRMSGGWGTWETRREEGMLATQSKMGLSFLT